MLVDMFLELENCLRGAWCSLRKSIADEEPIKKAQP